MKLAYSTYGLQSFDVFDVIPRVAAIGYDALELNVGDAWPTAPEKLDADARSRLVEAYRQAGFPSPPLMNVIQLCAENEDVDSKGATLAATCELARDLNFDDTLPVMTTTLGHQSGSWDDTKEMIASQLAHYADIAEDYGATIAVEPHAGQEFDSPEKAVWLVEAMDRQSIRLNFDHSHFHVLGHDLQHCVDLCAPYTVHTHIKSGLKEDGRVKYQLPGEGSLDLVEYMRAVKRAGIGVPITVEVTGQIWNLDDYEPWPVAERCYRYLHDAAEKS